MNANASLSSSSPLQRPLLFYFAFLFALVISSGGDFPCHAAAEVVRQGSLDHLDVETLDYYMTTAVGVPKKENGKVPEKLPKFDYDLVVLFYASWCKNCHALAPIYDKIGTLLSAGTAKSKVIMGLFDCEKSAEAMEICTRANIKHYPTVAFFGLQSGATHALSSKKPRHMVKFGGNWQYGDAILDWIKSMSWLSQWHRAAWGRKLRNLFFFGMLGGGDDHKLSTKEPLPIGLPTSSSSNTGAASGISGNSATPEQLKSKDKEMNQLVTRSSILLDSILFPIVDETHPESVVNTGKESYSDVFTYLNQAEGGWNNKSNKALVMKMCALEVALDYCQRVTTHAANEWVKQNPTETGVKESELVEKIMKIVDVDEPYCGIIDSCIIADMKDPACRPDTCPFKDPTARRYLTACFSETLQQEYAKALKIDLNAK